MSAKAFAKSCGGFGENWVPGIVAGGSDVLSDEFLKLPGSVLSTALPSLNMNIRVHVQ